MAGLVSADSAVRIKYKQFATAKVLMRSVGLEVATAS
jgi:hypothetical protein